MKHPFKSLAAALSSALVCAACSRPSEAVEAPAYPTKTLDCTENAVVALPAGGLLNNMWGRASAGSGPWRQCLQSRERNGRTEYGWRWNWPTRDGLYAYPELLVGRSPWRKEPTNDARFPRRVDQTASMPIAFDIESDFSGKKNLAAEFWLTDANGASGNPTSQSIKVELMVWSDYSPGMVSAKDKPTATVTLDGAQWALYVRRDWGAEVGVAGPRWNFLVYRALTPSSSAHYDAASFFRDAMARGFVQPSDFITTVELGNEITSGAGSTWIKDFSIDVRP